MRVSLPHRRSTTVSLETNPLYSFKVHFTSLYLKKAGLASPNIVHLLKCYLRCIGLYFYIFTREVTGSEMTMARSDRIPNSEFISTQAFLFPKLPSIFLYDPTSLKLLILWCINTLIKSKKATEYSGVGARIPSLRVPRASRSGTSKAPVDVMSCSSLCNTPLMSFSFPTLLWVPGVLSRHAFMRCRGQPKADRSAIVL